MGRFRNLTDEEIERLLTGHAPADDQVAPLVDDLRTTLLQPPPEDVERRHLAAIAEEAVNAAAVPDPTTDRSPSMLRRPFSSLTAKVAAAAAAALVLTGGAAAAGALPEPAQQALAAAAEKVGFSLPNPAHERAEQQGHDDENGEEDGEENGKGHGDENNGKRANFRVHEVLQDESLVGRDKGDAVSDAASANRQDVNRRPSQPSPEDNRGGADPTTPSGDPTDRGQNPPSGDPGFGNRPSSDGTTDDDDDGDPSSQGTSRNPTGRGRP